MKYLVLAKKLLWITCYNKKSSQSVTLNINKYRTIK
jgi:hypothetical protein